MSKKGQNKRIILFVLLWTSGLFGFSQINLIPNPSFEARTNCPYEQNQLNFCDHWFNVSSSNEYFHLCTTNPIFSQWLTKDGGEPPRTDSAMIGSIVFGGNYREYPGVKLAQPLERDTTYCLQLWISLANGAGHYIDRFDAILTQDIPVVNDPLHPAVILASPTIILATHHLNNDDGWERIDTTYCASGGEEYLTLGIFSPADSINEYKHHPLSESSSYYFIDDVALYPCDAPVDSAKAGADVFFCKGDSVQLGTHDLPEYRYYWYIDTVLVSREASPVFAPTQTTTYTLLVKDFKFDETRDTVTAHWVNCDTIPLGCDQKKVFVCQGDSVQLGCHNKSNYTYAWQQLPDTTLISTRGFLMAGDQAARYVLQMTDYTRRSQSDTIEVIPVDCKQISADAGNDTTICLGDSLKLGGLPVEGVKYLWLVQNTPLDSASQIWVQPGESVQYKLEMLDPRKTLYEDWCNVSVIECDIPLTIPNVFSPNGDGINDFFQIENPRNAAYELLIFNRWGSMILQTNQDKLWDGTVDGKPVASGTYFYSLTATLPPYRTTRLQGTVMVLRGQ